MQAAGKILGLAIGDPIEAARQRLDPPPRKRPLHSRRQGENRPPHLLETAGDRVRLTGVGNAQTIMINLIGVTDGTNTGNVSRKVSGKGDRTSNIL